MIYYIMTYDDERIIFCKDTKIMLTHCNIAPNLTWNHYLIYSKKELELGLINDCHGLSKFLEMLK